MDKTSTKKCQQCGSEAIIKLISLNLKICNDCGLHMPWNLDPGQKPLFDKNKPSE